MNIMNAKCKKCNVLNQPGILLIRYADQLVCGKCYSEHKEKINKEKMEKFITG